MALTRPSHDAFFIVTILLIGFLLLFKLAQAYAKHLYHQWLSSPVPTPLDVDSFVDSTTNPPKYLKIAFLQRLSVGDRRASNETVHLSSFESPYLHGLQVTQRAERRLGSSKAFIADSTPVVVDSEKPMPLVVGTIRMGFGHHRIAYAACSWALPPDEDNARAHDSRITYFHDLLNIDSDEADLIHSTDKTYSKLSRIASNLGGFIERLWGKAMLSGDADALRISGLTALHLRPLFKGLPTDTPIIATHCYVALAAVAAGMTNVINLVIDNHPQWFVVVPGCLNLVQGPVNYHRFLQMGVKPENIQLAGHWIPRELVQSINDDCMRRIARSKSGFVDPSNTSFSPSTSSQKSLKSNGTRKPRRFLIPVGGAGAQRKFIVQFLRSLESFVRNNQVQLFLNAGDHSHMRTAFEETLSDIGFGPGTYNVVTTLKDVKQFQRNLLDGKEPATAITLFAFEEYFPAVATTDILCRVADVLACKPSELAFYPVPKLMIRRVGDHEQFSALRAAELGDGTLEAREIEDAISFVTCVIKRPELLVTMNECIMKNATAGIYDGCKNAVKLALERST